MGTEPRLDPASFSGMTGQLVIRPGQVAGFANFSVQACAKAAASRANLMQWEDQSEIRDALAKADAVIRRLMSS